MILLHIYDKPSSQFQRASSHAMSFESWRQAPVSPFGCASGFVFDKASRFASRSTARYLFVVFMLVWPSQWAMVLRSLPARSKNSATLTDRLIRLIDYFSNLFRIGVCHALVTGSPIFSLPSYQKVKSPVKFFTSD